MLPLAAAVLQGGARRLPPGPPVGCPPSQSRRLRHGSRLLCSLSEERQPGWFLCCPVASVGDNEEGRGRSSPKDEVDRAVSDGEERAVGGWRPVSPPVSLNTAKLQSKYSKTMRLFPDFFTHLASIIRGLCCRRTRTPRSLRGLVCLNRTSQHGDAGIRRVYSNSHLPFKKKRKEKNPQHPGCSMLLLPSDRPGLEREARRHRRACASTASAPFFPLLGK